MSDAPKPQTKPIVTPAQYLAWSEQHVQAEFAAIRARIDTLSPEARDALAREVSATIPGRPEPPPDWTERGLWVFLAEQLLAPPGILPAKGATE